MKTLLGVCDGVIKDNSQASWDCNKIGGIPVWINKSIPVPSCKVCSNQQLLITQLYCPLENSVYHRVLYVFACINKRCWNLSDSWTVYRVQMLDTCVQKQAQSSSTNIEEMFATDDAWGDEDTEDWGDESSVVTTESKKLNVLTHGGAVQCDALKAKDSLTMSVDDSGANSIKGNDKMNQLSYSDALKSQLKWNANDSQQSKLGELAPMPNNACQQQTCKKTTSTAEKFDNFGLHTIDLSEGSDVEINPMCIAEDIPESAMNVLSYLNTKNDSSIAEHEKGSDFSKHSFFMPYYLSVFEESVDMEVDKTHAEKLLHEYVSKEKLDLEQLMEPSCSSSKSGGVEKYEKVPAKHGDNIFQKFLKVVQHCQEQCIRYCWNGKPLNMTIQKQQKLKILSCSLCGGERIFEFQLMPMLVSVLQIYDKTDPILEFGTVMIYSCKNSCWDEDSLFQQEYVQVQEDPDQQLFK